MIQTHNEYLDHIEHLQQEINQSVAEIDNDIHLKREFLSYKTTRRKFLPDYPDSDLEFYRRARFNIKLSSQIERNTSANVLLNLADVEGNTAFTENVNQRPFIFCTFHFGSYGLVGKLLEHFKFNFSVLTLRAGITSDMLHKEATEKLEVLHSDSPGVMLDMMNKLKEGKSIMAFLDGIGGMTEGLDSRSFSCIKFRGHNFYCKKGLPLLSYISGVPIIPVVSYRKSFEKIKVVFGDPIYPSPSVKKDEYVKNTIQKCYSLLQNYLTDYSEQWLYWSVINDYVENDLERSDFDLQQNALLPTDGQFIFNEARYEIHEVRQSHFLFDKGSYNSFLISGNLSLFLSSISTSVQNFENLVKRVNKKLLEDLLKKHVLVSVNHI